MDIYIYIHTYIYIYIHTCIYIYIYIYTYRHVRNTCTLNMQMVHDTNLAGGAYSSAHALRQCMFGAICFFSPERSGTSPTRTSGNVYVQSLIYAFRQIASITHRYVRLVRLHVHACIRRAYTRVLQCHKMM